MLAGSLAATCPTILKMLPTARVTTGRRVHEDRLIVPTGWGGMCDIGGFGGSTLMRLAKTIDDRQSIQEAVDHRLTAP